MGVRVDAVEQRCAIFDSASGFAFGPTFESISHAESFLDFLADVSDRDPREQSDHDMMMLHLAWNDACDRLDALYEAGDLERASDGAA